MSVKSDKFGWDTKAQEIVNEPVFLKEGQSATILYGKYEEITDTIEGIEGKFETFTAKNVVLDCVLDDGRQGKIKVDQKTFVDIVNQFKQNGMPNELKYKRPRAA